MMYSLLIYCLFTVLNAQYYNIESDNVFTIENMVNDIHYDRIHRFNVAKTDAFHEMMKTSSLSFTDIRCRHYKDFYYLLYTMCQRSVLCAEMYYLETDTTTSVNVNKVNFKKFVYQLALSQLFIVHDHAIGPTTTTTTTATNSSPQLFILEDNVPIEWIPRYIIHLEDTPLNVPCHLSVNLTTEEYIPFVHSTLYLLHAYKYYVVNDYKCNQFNQWLILDAHNRPVCVCRHGKSCNPESNYRILIIILTTIILMMFVLWVISFFVSTPRLIKKMDEANRLRNKGV